jgi:hypothetical protein
MNYHSNKFNTNITSMYSGIIQCEDLLKSIIDYQANLEEEKQTQQPPPPYNLFDETNNEDSNIKQEPILQEEESITQEEENSKDPTHFNFNFKNEEDVDKKRIFLIKNDYIEYIDNASLYYWLTGKDKPKDLHQIQWKKEEPLLGYFLHDCVNSAKYQQKYKESLYYLWKAAEKAFVVYDKKECKYEPVNTDYIKQYNDKSSKAKGNKLIEGFLSAFENKDNK